MLLQHKLTIHQVRLGGRGVDGEEKRRRPGGGGRVWDRGIDPAASWLAQNGKACLVVSEKHMQVVCVVSQL